MPAANTPRVILGRHGQTVFNRDGLVMGRSDSPLTPNGTGSAQALAQILVDERIGTIFSSPLGRAFSTAGIYGEALNLPVVKKEGMAELSCGQWEGKERESVVTDPGTLRTTWIFRPPGGESYEDAECRVSQVIRDIRCQMDGRTVLVVGHASVNRVFLKLWLDLEAEHALQLDCPHEVLYCLEPDGEVHTRSVSRAVLV